MIKQSKDFIKISQKDLENEQESHNENDSKNQLPPQNMLMIQSEDALSPRSQVIKQPKTDDQITCMQIICAISLVLLILLLLSSLVIVTFASNTSSSSSQKQIKDKVYVIAPKQKLKVEQSIQNPINISKQISVNTNQTVSQKNKLPIIQIYSNQNEKEKSKTEKQKIVKVQPMLVKNLSKWEKINMEIKQARKYFQIQIINKYKQLPFCIIPIAQSQIAKQQITKSIQAQTYTNFIIINAPNLKSKNYFAYKQIIQSQCHMNTLVIFLKNPINRNTLQYLNQIHQQYNVYATYSVNQESIQIYSFYSRVFDLILSNDFYNTNRACLANDCFEIIPLAILELCRLKLKKINEPQFRNISQLSIKNNSRMLDSKRQEYNYLLKLSQNFNLGQNLTFYRNSFQILQNITKQKVLPQIPKKMMKSIERQQMLYLPKNHSLFDLQHLQYTFQYQLNKYQSKNKQIPFCITILSHNNIQNDRYKKVMLSILQQKYNNYHIVFLDDVSDDNNMNATIQFMRQHKFPKERIKYIQNKQRKFATYNIMNAIFNYCDPDDVQVLIDGDDQIIGAYVLQVLNAIYQKNPDLWVVYTNHLTNLYTYGASAPINNIQDILQGNKRYPRHIISHIQSWRVKLLYSIPLAHHQNQKKQWLDTVYDDALQHPLVELAGLQRILYIPQIMYLYNTMYGDNDDSTLQKRNHRVSTYHWILKLQPLTKLNSLEDSKKDADVLAIFEREKDQKFYVIQP